LKFCAILVFLFVSFSGVKSYGQNDSLPAVDTLFMAPAREHSVRRATVMSAVLPGLGQAYNKKYWKVPIVYAGIGTCVFFIADNTKNYRYFRDALIAETDNDPLTINPTGAPAATIRPVMEQYRQWLDLSYISLAVVYALNIIDAHVDAHLFYFDVGEDLQASIRPSAILTPRPNPGIRLTINF
jgi:hypothetical protein